MAQDHPVLLWQLSVYEVLAVAVQIPVVSSNASISPDPDTELDVHLTIICLPLLVGVDACTGVD